MFSAVAWKYASEQYAFDERGDDRQLVVVLGGGPRRVVRGRLARLDLEQHVGALVLDRLERADRTAELHAVLRVLDRHVEHELRAAHHLVGERDRGLVERLARTPAKPSPVLAERRRRDVGELELRLLARHVHRRQRRAGEAVGVAATVKNEMPSVPVVPASAGDDDDEVGGVPVDHEHLLAGEREAAALALGRLHRDAGGVPLARSAR